MTVCDICKKPIRGWRRYTLGPPGAYYTCCSEECLREAMAREDLDIEENTKKIQERAARITKAARILTGVNAAIVILQLLLLLARIR